MFYFLFFNNLLLIYSLFIIKMNSNTKIKTIKKVNYKIKKSNKNSKNKYNKTKKNKKTNKGKSKRTIKYTMNDVKKHNKKTDAWIVINKKVYNITDWIKKHPGGLIIMRGVGKDATQLFNNIGHSNYAKKILKTYFIGILK